MRTSQQATACRPTQADSITWSYWTPICPSGLDFDFYLRLGRKLFHFFHRTIKTIHASTALHVTAKKGRYTGRHWSPGILAAVPRPSPATLHLCHYLTIYVYFIAWSERTLLIHISMTWKSKPLNGLYLNNANQMSSGDMMEDQRSPFRW